MIDVVDGQRFVVRPQRVDVADRLGSAHNPYRLSRKPWPH